MVEEIDDPSPTEPPTVSSSNAPSASAELPDVILEGDDRFENANHDRRNGRHNQNGLF